MPFIFSFDHTSTEGQRACTPPPSEACNCGDRSTVRGLKQVWVCTTGYRPLFPLASAAFWFDTAMITHSSVSSLTYPFLTQTRLIPMTYTVLRSHIRLVPNMQTSLHWKDATGPRGSLVVARAQQYRGQQREAFIGRKPCRLPTRTRKVRTGGDQYGCLLVHQ